MYIELTTFAVPTFLITFCKIGLLIIGVWLVIGFAGMCIYHWSMDMALSAHKRDDEKRAKETKE